MKGTTFSCFPWSQGASSHLSLPCWMLCAFFLGCSAEMEATALFHLHSLQAYELQRGWTTTYVVWYQTFHWDTLQTYMKHRGRSPASGSKICFSWSPVERICYHNREPGNLISSDAEVCILSLKCLSELLMSQGLKNFHVPGREFLQCGQWWSAMNGPYALWYHCHVTNRAWDGCIKMHRPKNTRDF